MDKDQFLLRFKNALNSNTVAFIVRILFVAFILIGERMFLGPITHSRGKADILTSIAMMLLIILWIDKIANRIWRKILLSLIGALLIFFHLLADLYYRFFNAIIPFDIIHQCRDLFVVSGYGTGLIKGNEWAIAVIVPATLLFCILFKHFRAKPYMFIILIVLTAFGWTHRLNRPIQRFTYEMSSLPDYIHRSAYYWSKIGLGKSRYLQIVSDVEAAIPRNLKGYRVVENNGIMVEPLDSSQSFSGKKYNIIFILIESLRAYECGFLGASQSFTPRLDKLTESSIVFTNFYANGSQTVRAELASLCSVYTNPIGVPDYLVNPNVKLISLPEILGNEGYDTLWFSGYTADFHNKRGFLSKHGINKIYDRDVFPSPKEPEIGWGMNDCEMFENVWNILKDAKEPFFAQITTLSNHVAKESTYPTESQTPVANGSKQYIKYTEGIYYTDYAVSQFIERIMDSPLADNTIICAMGDHGLWLFPKEITDQMQKLEVMFRVPLCIWGPKEIIDPGRNVTLGSQVDFSPTLMDLLDIKQRNTFLGQSLLDTDVISDGRYVATFLGSVPHIRVGDIFSLSKTRLKKETSKIGRYAKVEKMDTYKKDSYYFMRVEGDLLHGDYITIPEIDAKRTEIFSKRLDDIVFLTIYGLYMNAYEGVKD